MIGTWLCLRMLAAHVDARQLGQHHVEQHEVGLDGVEHARGPARRRGRPGRGSPPAEPDGERVDEGLLVLDDEHVLCAGHGQPASATSSTATGPGPAGTRSVNVEPTPSADSTETAPPWLVATWRTMARPEPGAAGLAAAGPVDPVEALEDAVEVAGRDADAVVGDHAARPIGRRVRPHLDGRAGVGVLHAVLEEVGQRRHELAAVAEHGEAPRRLVDDDVDVALVGERRTRSTASATSSADGHHLRSAAGRPARCGDSSSRSSMMRADAVGLGDHALGQAAHERGVVLVGDRLGQQGQRADGRLELVADVGDEVGAHGLEARRSVTSSMMAMATPAPSPRRAAARTHDDAPRRPEDLERLRCRLAAQARCAGSCRRPRRRARRRGGRR